MYIVDIHIGCLLLCIYIERGCRIGKKRDGLQAMFLLWKREKIFF
nr:MAG TPA: hypothetical protein [Caudoviricetes sp.]DAV35993.1 MAG TPA: hypothetical protein [Caudoviricetes sp.]